METEIRAGMDLLDQLEAGWQREVDLDMLDQNEGEWSNDGGGCILVHVFGEYYFGLRQLELDESDAEKYGFDLGKSDMTEDRDDRGYQFLTAMWKRLIRARYGKEQG